MAEESQETKALEIQIEALKEELKKLHEEKNDGKYLMGAVQDRKFSASANRKLSNKKKLTGHYGKIYALQWSAQGKQIVSAAQDGKLIVWHGFLGHKLHVISLQSPWVMTCGYSPNGAAVACGGLDNYCTIYKLQDLKHEESAQLRHHEGYLSSCTFFGNDKVLTSSGDKTAMLWDVGQGQTKLERTFKGHTWDVVSLSADETKNLFVTGSCDKTAKLWDVRQENSVMTFHGHEKEVNSVNMLKGGNVFLTGSEDGLCRLFDIRSYKMLASYGVEISDEKDEEEPVSVTSVAFSKTGQYFFAGYDSATCRLWNTLDTTAPKQKLTGHIGRVSCLGVEPKEGCALATGDWGDDYDAELRIWA